MNRFITGLGVGGEGTTFSKIYFALKWKLFKYSHPVLFSHIMSMFTEQLQFDEAFYTMVRRSRAASVEKSMETATRLPSARVFEMGENGEIVSRPLEKVQYLDDNGQPIITELGNPYPNRSKAGSVSGYGTENKAKTINDFSYRMAVFNNLCRVQVGLTILSD